MLFTLSPEPETREMQTQSTGELYGQLQQSHPGGNLTRDPELRYTPKGTAIAKIGLAVNRMWKNEAGEMKEEVTFVDVDVFGSTAETIGQYMKKGRPILD